MDFKVLELLKEKAPTVFVRFCSLKLTKLREEVVHLRYLYKLESDAKNTAKLPQIEARGKEVALYITQLENLQKQVPDVGKAEGVNK